MEICKSCQIYDESGSGCLIPGTGPCCNKNKGEEINGVLIKGCGCSLSVKGRSLSSECPLKKWGSVMSQQDEQILKHQLDDNQ